MPEREHFTNFRCFIFGTGLALMATAFGAQVSGWTHWITIGVGYGIGIVLILIATVLITKSYFSRESEHPSIAPTPSAPTSPSRLKIISAFYGVETGPDKDVAEEYLRPKILGHSLVGWVGSDFFGPLDPAIGKHKRLKVRYSFDGEEATVVRQEHELLVLPEDTFLRAQLEACRTDLSQSQEADRQRAEDLRESANRNLEYRAKLAVFSALQWDALQLADDLAEFLKELGPAPAPKYSYEEIQRMPLAESRRLIEENDGDYAEACEYHNGKGSMRLTQEGLYKQLASHNLRMWPWYDKVQASYEERFAPKVQSVQRQFVIATIPADALGVAIGGPDGTKNIRAIASKLWELAYKLKEKELPNDKDPRLS